MLSHKQRGMSLIELLIALTILGILMAISVPAFQGTVERRKLVGAAESLFAGLQYARSEAIKRNETVRFQVSTGANWCFGVHDVAGTVCDCNADACLVGGVSRNVTSTDYDNIQMIAGGVIEFDPRQGIPDATAIYTFRVGGAGGNERDVIVNPIGRIKMEVD